MRTKGVTLKNYINYNDNGIGFKEMKLIENDKSIGLDLISSFVEQLEGELIQNEVKKGASYTLMFPS